MAIAKEVGSAQWVDFNDDTNSGSASDGLGDSEIGTEPHTGLFEGLSSGTHYAQITPNDDGSVTVKISQSASASTAVQLSINVSVYPVQLDISGVTVDSSGGLNALVGQGITASLSGMPPECTSRNLHWQVDGEKVAGFYASPIVYSYVFKCFSGIEVGNGGAVQLAPDIWSTAAPHWYWSDNGSNWGAATPRI
jgi:hypothetical protein